MVSGANAGYNCPVNTSPPGLRTQLLVGLTVIILVAAVSVGVITVWTTRQQVIGIELDNGRLLGHGLSSVLAGAMSDGHAASAKLQRVVASIAVSNSVQTIEVVDRRLNVLIRSGGSRASLAQGADLAAAINTQQQVVRVLRGEKQILAVSTPIFVRGKLVGGVRLQILMGPDRFGWPRLFWVLMSINGVIVVLFVTGVLTRYVIRPVEAMQRAAARVTEGDLSVTLAEDGARELASLAGSFNTMTASVKDQLQRLELQASELATSREHLIRSEKLASVGRLAAGVAHEVGNPLQAIVGFTEILLKPGLDPEEQADLLRRIRGETQRIHVIIRELLDFARPVEDATERVDLQSVVEQSLQLVVPQQRFKEVQVVQQQLADLPPVAANAQRLIQVLVNLLLNAADAMQGAQGTISVSGRGADQQEGGRQVQLLVSNTGAPIPDQLRRRIFDPFFSTKEPGQGTGLGLAVAQSIMESFGGSLELDTEQEATTFVVNLPVWEEGEEA